MKYWLITYLFDPYDSRREKQYSYSVWEGNSAVEWVVETNKKFKDGKYVIINSYECTKEQYDYSADYLV